MLRRSLLRGLWVALSAVTALTTGACADDTATSARLDGPGVTITVAPLNLPGVTDADYNLTVQNASSQVVFNQLLSSSDFGDSAGSLSFVGPCDASDNNNTVSLELLALYEGAGGASVIDPSTYRNPGLIARNVTCVANADVLVAFDITILRDASQGFFDIAVEFDDIFCSAKLDCGATTAAADDIRLLFDDAGQRNTTAVLGFACTPGTSAAETYLYLDNLNITCEGTGNSAIVDVGQVGNIDDLTADPGANPDGYLFAAAVYRDNEQIANKSFWNVALGLDRSAFAAAGNCTLTTAGTVTDTPLADLTTTAGQVYPIVEWNVQLSNSTGRVCTAHAINAGDGAVATRYTSDGTPVTFDRQYQRGTGLVTEGCEPTDCGVNAGCVGPDCACDPGFIGDPLTQCDEIGIFATSQLYRPDFMGGLAGADAICQGVASGEGLPGNWMAVLSDSDEDAGTRMAIRVDPIRETNGDLVRSNGVLFQAGVNLLSSIDHDETGALVAGSTDVWTGTDATGVRDGPPSNDPSDFCRDWTCQPGLTIQQLRYTGNDCSGSTVPAAYATCSGDPANVEPVTIRIQDETGFDSTFGPVNDNGVITFSTPPGCQWTVTVLDGASPVQVLTYANIHANPAVQNDTFGSMTIAFASGAADPRTGAEYGATNIVANSWTQLYGGNPGAFACTNEARLYCLAADPL